MSGQAGLDRAAVLRDELKWDEAEAVLRGIVANAADDIFVAGEAQYQIGRYLLERGRLEQAEVELRRVEDGYSDVTTAVMRAKVGLVDAMVRSNRCEQAGSVAEELLAGAGDSTVCQAWAKLKQGDVAMCHGSRSDAAILFEEVIRDADSVAAEPANWARVQLMGIRAHTWRLDDVLTLCQDIINQHSRGDATRLQAAWALYWKAYALKQAGRSAEAVDPLEMAAALATPTWPDMVHYARFALGEAYRCDNQHVKALEQYQLSLDATKWLDMDEAAVDLARLQVGSETRHLGMKERAVAILRVGIGDPASLSKSDGCFVEQITSFLDRDEGEAWMAYVSDPIHADDPTRQWVKEYLQTEASSPSSGVVNREFDRAIWLGRFYEQQRDCHRAEQAYLQARAIAALPVEHVQVCNRLCRLYFMLCGSIENAMCVMEDLDAYALEVVRTGVPADAHFAMDQSVWARTNIHPLEERSDMRGASQVAEALESVAVATGEPSKAAFARYMRMRVLSDSQQWEEASALATVICQAYGASERPDVREVYLYTLLIGSYARFMAGDQVGAYASLETLEVVAGERFALPTAHYRRLMSAVR